MKHGAMLACLTVTVCLQQAEVHAQPWSWSLFGDAQFVEEGEKKNSWAIELVSDIAAEEPFAGIAFEPKHDTAFGDLRYLGTDYNADFVGVGSPRFQIALDTDGDGESDGNIFVYLGPYPDYTETDTGWQSTGNLLNSEDPIFDTTQLGGPFYTSYEEAVAVLGDAEVLEVVLVADSGFATDDGEQVVLVDNVRVDNFKLKAKNAVKKAER